MNILRGKIDVYGRVAGARLGGGADRGSGRLGGLLVFTRDDRRRLIRARPNLREGENDQGEYDGRDDDDQKYRAEPLQPGD